MAKRKQATKMLRLVDYNAVTREETLLAVNSLRLVGDGWYIKIDIVRDGLELTSQGLVDPKLVVLAKATNVVQIATTVARDKSVYDEAKRIAEIWEEDKKLRRKHNKVERSAKA